MKKAGELLSYFFDKPTVDQARRYSNLCDSWAEMVKTYNISAAADHAQIVQFERHVLLVETDHPGWIQILQTKQRELLHEFQRRFPELSITGISFRLSRAPMAIPKREPPEEPTAPPEEEPEIPDEELTGSGYEKMDTDLQNTFKRLKQHLKRRSREQGEG